MTVKELIEELKHFPEDAKVVATTQQASYPDQDHDIDEEFFDYRKYGNILSLITV